MKRWKTDIELRMRLVVRRLSIIRKEIAYGLQQSPKLWQDHFATVMEHLGLRRCKSDSNLYCHKSRSLYVLADVGNLLIVGDAKLKKEFIMH